MNQKTIQIDELTKQYDDLYQIIKEYDDDRMILTNSSEAWCGTIHPKRNKLDTLKKELDELKGRKHNKRTNRKLAE
jgi:chromosome segregation ATPase